MFSPADPDSLQVVSRLDAGQVAQVFGICPQATTGRIRRNRCRTLTNPSSGHGETTRLRSSYASGRGPANVECRKMHTLMKYRRSPPENCGGNQRVCFGHRGVQSSPRGLPLVRDAEGSARVSGPRRAYLYYLLRNQTPGGNCVSGQLHLSLGSARTPRRRRQETAGTRRRDGSSRHQPVD